MILIWVRGDESHDVVSSYLSGEFGEDAFRSTFWQVTVDDSEVVGVVTDVEHVTTPDRKRFYDAHLSSGESALLAAAR